ncbi:hypothetical protein, unlikely [Trypanosoma brucei gambiense DAL972]|uniref:Uncharacterized protein n=1 Tax=Trypanosoma brucei gambiense (strain MHOM/CI/86/DAL972) TaxID=679716 RepID=C9ZPT3_TRYB9|nr:hypothetical protein, unlikely [Trypanosoma brucei gambiense DAL972]CBH11411.1 hypothetical protein, unlikely [Trypanosoma brucei gambiense DAL972]|eukprot:XP_011773698.1 hypothetical protein, unlikely [Trypanosoma brucei gambiense DAL972]
MLARAPPQPSLPSPASPRLSISEPLFAAPNLLQVDPDEPGVAPCFLIQWPQRVCGNRLKRTSSRDFSFRALKIWAPCLPTFLPLFPAHWIRNKPFGYFSCVLPCAVPVRPTSGVGAQFPAECGVGAPN